MTAMTTKSCLLAAASLFALSAAPAMAQEATTVDEIVVTLQKREQAISDVPTALTAYTGDFLEQIGVSDFAELSLFTPGFEVQDQSPNNPGFVIRGITSDSGEAFVEPRVSVFQDGVSIAKARGSYVELFDVERVEIAKGPQSTLFGRGALIGAVNIIQNKASLAGPDAMLGFSAGDYGYLQGEAMANLPLGDSFAVRGAFRYRQRDGYVDSLLGGEDFNSLDTAAARLSFRWAPSDRVNADLILNYQVDNPAGTSFKSRSFLPTNPTTGAVIGTLNPSDGAALAAGAGFLDGTALGLEREVYGATALVDFELSDSLTLSSITATRRFNALEIVDGDGFSLPVLTFSEDAQGEQFSQEFRLAYDNGGRVRGFVGVGYFDEEGTQRTPAQFDERVLLAQVTGAVDGNPAGVSTTPLPLAAFGNTAFTGALVQGLVFASSGNQILLSSAQAQAIAANLRGNHAETATNGSELQSYDVFGDISFDVTDRLQLGAGVRFTSDEKTSSFSSAVTGAQRSVLGGVLGASGLALTGPTGLAQANAILGALAVPGAAFIPPSMAYPVPQFGLGFQPTAGNGSTVSQDLEDEGVTWRLTARYEVTPDLNLYGNYARGRRPEVLSVGGPAAPGGAPRFNQIEAETVDSYEVGFKATELLGGALSLDTALFYYAYENFQTVEQQGTLFVTTNAGEATSYGLETQGFWAVHDQVDLFATYAYNHSRFETGILDGNRFRLSPDHTASIGASVRLPLGGGELRFTPTYTWQSEVFFDDNNDIAGLQQPPRAFVADNVQDETQDSYGLFNLRIAYTPDAGNWEVELFADNILDEEYIKDAGNTGDGLGLPTFIAGAPSMYGAQVKLRY